MGRRTSRDLPLEWIEAEPAARQPAAPLLPAGDGADHTAGTGPRRRRWWPLLLLVAIAAAAAVGWPPGHRGRGSPPVTAPDTTTIKPLSHPVEVTDVGHPFLAAPPGWELVGRAAVELVRIQLEEGRVIRTQVPGIQSTGPTYLVAGRDRVIVRPLDFVAGYVVPDGQVPEQLTSFAAGGPAFPGPDDQHLWLEVDQGDQRQMELFGFDGRATGQVIPSTNTFPLAGDGTGHLLFERSDGVYLAGNGTLTRIGNVLAVGPTRWLTENCAAPPTCELTVTDRQSGAARSLGRYPLIDLPLPLGQISPDGATAALLEDAPDGPRLHLLDLASGRNRALGARLNRSDGTEQQMAWSPDGRTLFYLDAAGTLDVVDAGTGAIHHLGVALPPMAQLVFRNRG